MVSNTRNVPFPLLQRHSLSYIFCKIISLPLLISHVNISGVCVCVYTLYGIIWLLKSFSSDIDKGSTDPPLFLHLLCTRQLLILCQIIIRQIQNCLSPWNQLNTDKTYPVLSPVGDWKFSTCRMTPMVNQSIWKLSTPPCKWLWQNRPARYANLRIWGALPLQIPE